MKNNMNLFLKKVYFFYFINNQILLIKIQILKKIVIKKVLVKTNNKIKDSLLVRRKLILKTLFSDYIFKILLFALNFIKEYIL